MKVLRPFSVQYFLICILEIHRLSKDKSKLWWKSATVTNLKRCPIEKFLVTEKKAILEMGKLCKTQWSGITCSAFHHLAQICALGIGVEKKVVICNDEVCVAYFS